MHLAEGRGQGEGEPGGGAVPDQFSTATVPA